MITFGPMKSARARDHLHHWRKPQQFFELACFNLRFRGLPVLWRVHREHTEALS